MTAIQFTRCYYAFSQVSSLVVNREIIHKREVKYPGRVLQEVVCIMRHWEGNFCKALGLIFNTVFLEAHS